MRCIILTTLCVLAFPWNAEAKYRPLPLDDLLRKSDLVLHGKIVSLADTTFEVKIEQVVAGEYKAKTITIQRFRDWTCAQRWTPYTEQQHVLLCLERMKEKSTGSTRYRIRSGGGEGEMPIVRGNVYVHGPSSIKLQRKNYADICGATINAQQVPLQEISRLTKTLRKGDAPAGKADGSAPKPPANRDQRQ